MAEDLPTDTSTSSADVSRPYAQLEGTEPGSIPPAASSETTSPFVPRSVAATLRNSRTDGIAELPTESDGVVISEEMAVDPKDNVPPLDDSVLSLKVDPASSTIKVDATGIFDRPAESIRQEHAAEAVPMHIDGSVAQFSAEPQPLDEANIENGDYLTEQPASAVHRISWSVAAEKGYQTLRTVQNDFIRAAIHPDLEDIHWPTLDDRERMCGQPGGLEREEAAVMTALWALEDAIHGSNNSTSAKRRKRKPESSEGEGNIRSAGGFLSERSSRLALNQAHKESADGASATTNQNEGQSTDNLQEKEGGAWSVSDLTEEDAESRRVAMQARYQLLLQAAQALTSSTSQLSTTGIPRVFVLADGHGGIRAARFFVPRTRDLVYELVASKTWDFDFESERELWAQKIESLFASIDAEYVALQVEAYRKWKEDGAVHAQRPLDDGCTLIVTVLIGGWFINMNVGDSRTVVYSRQAYPTYPGSAAFNQESQWVQDFSSVDHNMSHSGKVWEIHRSGGQFICPPGAPRPVQIEPPESRQHRPYHELNGGRIFRQSSDPVKAVGVSHRRTLNLTATMGDLLFKINPPVLSPRPDISFMRLDASRDYALVMATDGVWDHLLAQGSDLAQNQAVLGVVAEALAAAENDRILAPPAAVSVAAAPASDELTSGSAFRLLQAATSLALREAEFLEEPVGNPSLDPTAAAAAAAATSLVDNAIEPEAVSAGSDLSDGAAADVTAPVAAAHEPPRDSQAGAPHPPPPPGPPPPAPPPGLADAPASQYAVMRLPPGLLRAVEGLYAHRLPRYDDATAFVVLLEAEREP
ncbi:hypothetical protein HK405_009641, partial [Cladochytrium tenue]